MNRQMDVKKESSICTNYLYITDLHTYTCTCTYTKDVLLYLKSLCCYIEHLIRKI